MRRSRTADFASRPRSNRKVNLRTVLVDAHVHIHDCFGLETFFDQAYRNFCSVARQHGWSSPLGVLMLTESARFFILLATAGRCSNARRSSEWSLFRMAPVERLASRFRFS